MVAPCRALRSDRSAFRRGCRHGAPQDRHHFALVAAQPFLLRFPTAPWNWSVAGARHRRRDRRAAIRRISARTRPSPFAGSADTACQPVAQRAQGAGRECRTGAHPCRRSSGRSLPSRCRRRARAGSSRPVESFSRKHARRPVCRIAARFASWSLAMVRATFPTPSNACR